MRFYYVANYFIIIFVLVDLLKTHVSILSPFPSADARELRVYGQGWWPDSYSWRFVSRTAACSYWSSQSICPHPGCSHYHPRLSSYRNRPDSASLASAQSHSHHSHSSMGSSAWGSLHPYCSRVALGCRPSIHISLGFPSLYCSQHLFVKRCQPHSLCPAIGPTTL